MRVVTAPHDVAEAQGGRRTDGAGIMLEGGVDLTEDDLAGSPRQLGANEHVVLPVSFVHPVGECRDERGTAFSHHDSQAGVAIQHTGRHEMSDGALRRIERLHIVDDGATRAPGHLLFGTGADVEADRDVGLGHGRPQRLPDLVVEVAAFRRSRRQEHRPVTGRHSARQLGDGIVSVKHREHGHSHETRRDAHDLRQAPVVVCLPALAGQLPISHDRRPERPGREDDLGPNPLLVEVFQPDARVLGTGRPHRVGERDRIAANDLPVDVDGLPAIRPLGARSTVREPLREGVRPQIVRLKHVRVRRVDPDLRHVQPPHQSV